MKSAGDEITASTTLYVYKETGTTPNCWAENSFDITINYTPTPDDPADVTECDSYTLPALSADNYYYTGSGKTGDMKSAGDAITASTKLYVYKETGTTPNCWAENSFDITINYTPTPDDPADVTECDSYTLPALSADNYYYNGSGKTGDMKSAGDEITASTTLYVYKETGTTPNCWAENSFDITISSTPAAPSVTYNAPACDQTTFSVTITGVVDGATYTITDRCGNSIVGVSDAGEVTAVGTSDITFSNIPAGSGYQVTVQIGICTSTAQSCGSSEAPCPDYVAIQTLGVENYQADPVSIQKSATIETTSSELSIKAYPNPFSSQVKFEVTVPEAGNGSLELVNMMGQKIKTIYQGYMNAGVSSYEVSLPEQKSATLIYLFRVEGKQLSGKLVQVNK